MPKNQIVVALAGNPNSGKTTVFNNLTGARQHVGNWPGVTVEKKEGSCSYDGHEITVVDLPGVYSLTAYSPDEVVARNFIVDEKPDVVVDIVDATNLERNLYLAVQLMEMEVPFILALNMMDEVESRQYKIDTEAVSREMGVPVVQMTANRNKGTTELLAEIVRSAEQKPGAGNIRLEYGREVDREISRLMEALSGNDLARKYSPRWLAIKLIEGDSEIINKFEVSNNNQNILKTREESLSYLKTIYGDDAETIIADARYGFISGLLKDALKKPALERVSISDKIDKFVINRWLGIPIFLLLMYGVFQFVFSAGTPFMDWIDEFFGWLGGYTSGISPDWLGSLVTDGILGGLGSVLIFIPNIFLLFIAISILEDSGYMARAAFVMDRLMHKIGLHGRSFIPMILGFGCNIPGIMACRTIENPKDRLTTILVNPFMLCGARLPIFVLLVGTFFPENQGLVLFSMYLLGIIVAILAALVFRKTILKGESSHFVMELPPYRLPTLFGIVIHMWERGRMFLVKAGTIIFGVVLAVWFLSSMPWGVEYASIDSWIGQIGSFIAPVFAPAGFGQWQASVSVLFGFLAKEVVVGTMGAIFGVEEGILGGAIAEQLGWTPLIALSFMVFCLLYVPCVAALGAIRGETKSWKWTGFAALYTTVVAWVLSVLVYQIGRLFVQ